MREVDELRADLDAMQASQEAFIREVRPTMDLLQPVARSQAKQRQIEALEAEGNAVVTRKPKQASASLQGNVTALAASIGALVMAWQSGDWPAVYVQIGAVTAGAYSLYGILRRRDLT